MLFRSSLEFDHFLSRHGVKREFANTGTPSDNGVVERKHRTGVEMSRTMLTHSQLPQFLWAEAMMTAIHTLNRSPTSAVPGMTPYQAYYGSKPDVSHFRVFGCDAYVHIPKTDRGKLDPKSQKLLFVGYNPVSTGYRLYDPRRLVISLSRDVIFDEQVPSSPSASPPILGDPSDAPDRKSTRLNSSHSGESRMPSSA